MELAVFVRLFCTCGAEATGTDIEFLVLITCRMAAWVYRWNVSSAWPLQKCIGMIYYNELLQDISIPLKVGDKYQASLFFDCVVGSAMSVTFGCIVEANWQRA